ncbi:MAG: hypothetical protein KatS3mg002_1289 [Candidatus Woesearchaeota archaeon]|nr:MAG: hypothetical protein KatS3mg002_1289 [Candidatus Woesearchaeota archaeon]
MLFITLNTYCNKGGIETFNQYFINGLKDNQFHYKSVSLYDKKVNDSNSQIACSGSIIKLIWFIFLNLRNSNTIIWGHINLIPLLFLFYPFFRKKRNILIVHGIDVWNPLFKNKLKILGVRITNEVWSVSNYTKKRFIENYHYPFEKVHIFSNTIKPKQSNNDSPYTNSSIKILSILRLQNREKILSVLRIIEVLPQLLKKQDIQYFIIGEGNYKNNLIQHIKQIGLSKQVHVLGYIDNTAPYLEHCDIFTLLSETEGFGIVLLEAMQFAKPCIAATNTGSEDVIRNGESGFLINPDDTFELYQKLLLLIENKDLRIKMGQKGKEIFESTFTYQHFCEKQKQLLLF